MRLTILIAISDSVIAQRYERFFRLSGFDVTRVASGTECWDWLERYQPDALILEETLPWGGGDGVLTRLREEADDVPFPVVMLSNSETDYFGVFGRRSRWNEEFPLVARFTSASSLPAILNAVLGGLRDCQSEKACDRESRLTLV